jgi:hypothetical protein
MFRLRTKTCGNCLFEARQLPIVRFRSVYLTKLYAQIGQLGTGSVTGFGARINLRSQGNCFLHPPSFNPDSPSMNKITRYIDKLTNSIPNGPTQTRARHWVSPPYPSTALPSASFPAHHGSSTLIHSRPKGLSMNDARRWIRKNITKRRRCMSFAQLHVTCAYAM